MGKSKTNNTDEFITNDILKSIDNHDQDIIVLSKRIAAIEEKFSSNEKIAETISTTIKTQTPLQTAIFDIMDKADRDYFLKLIKSTGSKLGGLIMLAIGIIIGMIVRAHFVW